MLKTLRRKTFSDLRANRTQFLAVWFVVMLGTAFYGALYPSGVNMIRSFFKTYDELNYMNFQLQFEPSDAATADIARNIEGVQEVEGRWVEDAGLQINPDRQYLITLRLISMPDNGKPTVNKSEITDGRETRAENEVLLLKSFADHHEIIPGDRLTVYINNTSHELIVAGLAVNPEYLITGRSPASPFPTPSTFGVAWLGYTSLTRLTGSEGQINEVVVHLEGDSADEDTALTDRVRKELEAAYADMPGVVVLERTQTASGGIIDALMAGNVPIMIFFSGLFLVGSTVITSILLGRMVQSERQRIGTMRAMGITRRELVQHYLGYGLIIGITGGLVGSVLGYLNSFWVMGLFIDYIVGGTLPEFTNTPQIPFLLLGFAVTVTGSTLAGMYPAWAESGTSPGIALRPSAPKKTSRLSQMKLTFLPLPIRQAIRNLFRVPGRSVSTALGVALGAMMIFSAITMWDTIEESFGGYFAANAFDLRVDMQSLQPAEQLNTQIMQIEGVQGVDPALLGPVTIIRANGDPYDAFAVALDENTPFLELSTVEGKAAFSGGEGVWLGSNLARILEAEVGDDIRLEAFSQQRTVRVQGIVAAIMGTPVYIPRSLLVQWTPGNAFLTNAALIRTEAGKEDDVRDALVDLPGMVAVERFSEFEGDLNTYLEYFRVGTLTFGGFGFILTLALLFNTVSASLRERQDELSVLRALGTSAREITTIVLIELMVMVVIGIAIGLPLGYQMGAQLIAYYDTDVYSALTAATPLSIIAGLVSLVGIVLLSALPGLRAVQRFDLGAVSKSKSI